MLDMIEANVDIKAFSNVLKMKKHWCVILDSIDRSGFIGIVLMVNEVI